MTVYTEDMKMTKAETRNSSSGSWASKASPGDWVTRGRSYRSHCNAVTRDGFIALGRR